MMENPTQREVDLKRLQDACHQLGEHFDTVQIFVTRYEPGEKHTVNAHYGIGNWLARYGQMREFLMGKDAQTAHQAISDESD